MEIIGALAEVDATVRDLAALLGRSRSALHYHIGVLEKAGVVSACGWRGTGRNNEAIYRVTQDVVVARAKRNSRTELDSAARAVRAMLRLTAREFTTSTRNPAAPRGGLLAMRGKAHFSPTDLQRLKGHVDAIGELLRCTRQPRPGRSIHAVTIVVTPVSRPARKRSTR